VAAPELAPDIARFIGICTERDAAVILRNHLAEFGQFPWKAVTIRKCPG
jgi:hypothetical protein